MVSNALVAPFCFLWCQTFILAPDITVLSLRPRPVCVRASAFTVRPGSDAVLFMCRTLLNKFDFGALLAVHHMSNLS